MTLSLIISMSLFALAASLSPGPVNLLSLSCSARYGLHAGLNFVTGATLGFILLFLLIGLGVHQILNVLPQLTTVLKWLGAGFLFYLSFQLWRDKGDLSIHQSQSAPRFMTGAIIQWLNPKAWLASVSGIAVYIPNANTNDILIFAGLYLPICWLSLGVWVAIGILLGQYFQSPAKMRWLNRSLAALLAGSSVYILV
ncbi:LysE family translocator [Marinomonas posidonica]|uniref:Lysine exporter protein (LYSE/YGGA) n=1 Tax=Marinomonas posidonica (strain CECT 7376 / NCIMB 14433 / IVIA-Po-181) TaxID=491952 RepID=F6D1E4_MARPP|nr:LysE family translocator [Marinomonas posidonica]AEF56033.1 Lysine exporter protein (LYSE/YGGA) [Marinomonas posidonica IVIA-Po-181]